MTMSSENKSKSAALWWFCCPLCINEKSRKATKTVNKQTKIHYKYKYCSILWMIFCGNDLSIFYTKAYYGHIDTHFLFCCPSLYISEQNFNPIHGLTWRRYHNGQCIECNFYRKVYNSYQKIAKLREKRLIFTGNSVHFTKIRDPYPTKLTWETASRCTYALANIIKVHWIKKQTIPFSVYWVKDDYSFFLNELNPLN